MRSARSTIALIAMIALLGQAAPRVVTASAAASGSDVLACHEAGTICPMHRPHSPAHGPGLREDCGNPDPATFAPIFAGAAVVTVRFRLQVATPPLSALPEPAATLLSPDAHPDSPPPRA